MKNDTWVLNLCTWFKQFKRPMPWRDNPQAYDVWISEIMLQQTQVSTVIAYFNRFMKQFPNIESLAKANLDDVLKCWEGLGYYSRARNLHKAAKVISENFKGIIPNNYHQLQSIPGIGPYSAAAIGSIAYEIAVPVIDGNVLRVFTRFWGIVDDIRQSHVKTMLFEKLSPYIKKAKPSVFNQAMMELGALICTPLSPKCDQCPIFKFCYAYKNHCQDSLPFKSKAKKTPTLDVVVGVIMKKNYFLIAKRPTNKMLGGLWELPGGKIEKNETPEIALIREIKEEVNLDVHVTQKLATIKHSYTHFHLRMHAYLCKIIQGNEKPNCSDQLAWINDNDLDNYAFPKANLKLFDVIKNVLFS